MNTSGSKKKMTGWHVCGGSAKCPCKDEVPEGPPKLERQAAEPKEKPEEKPEDKPGEKRKRAPSAWVLHVKAFQENSTEKISYKEAMKQAGASWRINHPKKDTSETVKE